MGNLRSIVIIGGGFSGICTALHIIEKADFPIKITLVEKKRNLCEGIAYGTTSPYHPLNVRAGSMGALNKQPGDFFAWLEEHSDNWRSLDSSFKSLKFDEESYVPRKLYAAYLKDIFRQALVKGEKKGIIFSIIHEEAIDANLTNRKIEIILKNRESFIADYLVLATGVPSSQTFPFETETLLNQPNYIQNMWNINLENVLKPLIDGDGGKEKTLAIIGSGLTAIDVLFTLQALNYQGAIQLISKKGTIPHVHEQKMLPPWFHLRIGNSSKRLLNHVTLFKKQRKEVEADGANWRQLIDSYRPYTQVIWQSFSLFEKKQFIRHLFSFWNKHRHRMSPNSNHIVQSFEKMKTITFIRGIVKDVTPLPNKKLRIVYYSKKGFVQSDIDCIMNCSGAEYRIDQNNNPLIQNLLKKQLILSDEIGLGLKASQKELLAGKGEGKIYALGALLFGERFETTAVPELREEAHSIADSIVSSLS